MSVSESIKNWSKRKSQLLSLPLAFELILFFVGWLGLNVVIAPIVANLLKLLLDNNAIDLTTANILLQLFCYLSLFVIFVALLLASKTLTNFFKNFAAPSAIKEGIVIGIIALCVTMSYNLITSQIFGSTSNDNQGGVDNFLLSSPLVGFLVVVILAPIVEELCYRAGLFGSLYRKSKLLAYLCSGVIFGFIHFNFEAKNIANEFINVPSYIFAGLILCYAYERKGNISSAVVAHAVNNFVGFIMLMLASII